MPNLPDLGRATRPGPQRPCAAFRPPEHGHVGGSIETMRNLRATDIEPGAGGVFDDGFRESSAHADPFRRLRIPATQSSNALMSALSSAAAGTGARAAAALSWPGSHVEHFVEQVPETKTVRP